MNLKRLVHRELSEGITEKELATAVGISEQTIADILADKPPQDDRIWEQFARYFHMDVVVLRSGGPPHLDGMFELTEDAQPSPLGPLRKVPLLRWEHIDQMMVREEPPRLVQAETMLETDVPGARTFALQVKDDSMEPLFSEGEIIFVDPDVSMEPGHYVLVASGGGGSEEMLLRQLIEMKGQLVLHALNPQCEDYPLRTRQQIRGRVVRVRKNV